MARPTSESFGELEWSLGDDSITGKPVPSSPEAAPAADATVPEARFGAVELELDSDPSVGAAAAKKGEGSDRSLGSVGSEPTVGAIGARAASLAAIRELYARGEAQEALALAKELNVHLGVPATMPPSASRRGGTSDQPTRGGSDESGTAIVDMGASACDPAIPRDGVPRVLLPLEILQKLGLDHRAGFLLAHVDGRQTMEEILDVCAMPEADALAIVKRLSLLGVIELA